MEIQGRGEVGSRHLGAGTSLMSSQLPPRASSTSEKRDVAISLQERSVVKTRQGLCRHISPT